ncbi:hypothetical protein FGO68_gene13288 [Halteria grandinella]|uniref:folate gamma-glutamyl hydrolase n=1 Tax=Halteria grandinella TaxID=5974 RepID=A0A8J8NLL2_HALGN|nr:hypothetical protein FGO68_gene13288 [Halteria grandinella]
MKAVLLLLSTLTIIGKCDTYPFELPRQTFNNRPMIGMLTQPLTEDMKAQSPLLATKTSFIQASYVQAVESAGARVVPLIYDNPDINAEIAKLDHVNGVQYNGGDGGAEYLVFSKKIYNRVKEINDAQISLPIWGTCMGFQYLAIFEATQGEGVLSENAFDSNDENYPLKFLVDPLSTRLFSPLGYGAQKYAENNLTYNHHHDGILPYQFDSDQGLKSAFKPTSISLDNQGRSFVASMESTKYPFFATQFHPEKQQYVFYPTVKVQHDKTAIDANRYFGDFFVAWARNNTQSFASYDEEVANMVQSTGILVMLKSYTGMIYAF